MSRNSFGRLPGDQGLIVEFRSEPIESAVKSAEEGRPVYDDRVCISIDTPGDRLCRIDTIATQAHFDRFPVEYDNFRKGEVNEVHGTHLKMWPAITAGQIKGLSHMKIFTVEALAAAPNLPGEFIPLKNKAQAWLTAVVDNGFALKAQAEIDALKAQLAELTGKQAKAKA